MAGTTVVSWDCICPRESPYNLTDFLMDRSRRRIWPSGRLLLPDDRKIAPEPTAA